MAKKQDCLGYYKTGMSDMEKVNIINVNYVKAVDGVQILLTEKCCMFKHLQTNFDAEIYLTCLPNNIRIFF